MNEAKIPYKMIFIDDHSTDKTAQIIENLAVSHPVKLYKKQGKIGKAYSIMEGVRYSDSEFVVMLDADLQYPPEAIPGMYEKAAEFGVVVGNRKDYEASFLRKFVSKVFNLGFGKILHGFKVDVQSGLKLFRREILNFVDEKDITPWTLDLSLLNTARNLGYKIGSVDITFAKRTGGQSKVNLIKTSAEIGKNALNIKLKNKKTYLLKPVHEKTMAGAGFVHNGKWFRTHTTLKPHNSALVPFHFSQIVFILLVIIALEVGFIFNPITTLITIVGILSFIYFIDVLFNLYVVLKSLHYPPEIISTEEEISRLKDEELPVYTILCPLYREVRIVPHFLEAVARLDYPKDKLDVKLLLEENDEDTIDAVRKMDLPGYVSTLIVPESQPKTKPKACNYGLNFATGEYLVVYDAEDQPEPDQLKKAYLAFKKSKPNVVCLQAKLNYFNPHQNLLTRFFTAEYSLWFDVMLTGLQSINTVIPLGGTSNHFKTKTLIELEGWDPFNVTEDCDLGVRLFKRGFKTAIIDSTTLEEANSNLKNWLRQRSRWIKGYMQTYLVHMRNPFEFIKNHGWHSFVFQLIIGARISFMLINPILWATTIAYFAFYQYTSEFIESLFPTVVFYFAVFSLLLGNFLYLYNYMIGSAKRGHWGLIKYVYLVPLYWFMASAASVIALYQLVAKPHYWEKTIHGLHLDKARIKEVKEKVQEEIKELKEEIKEEFIPEVTGEIIGDPWYRKIRVVLSTKKAFIHSSIFIFSSLMAGILNLGFNVYLGRVVSFEELGLVTLVNGILYFSNIPQAALSATITHKIGFFEGKKRPEAVGGFLKKTYKTFLLIACIFSVLWLVSIPLLGNFFNTSNLWPFLLFTPVWIFGIVGAIFRGLLSGKLLLGRMSLIFLSEPIIKFFGAFGLIALGLSGVVYSVIPLSIVASFLLALLLSSEYLKIHRHPEITRKENIFPGKFFVASTLSILAPMAFLSLDVLLAQHYLPPVEAGKYALVSLIGKIIYFLGVLVPQLILPIVSRNEGASKSSDKILTYVFIATFLFTGAGYLFWGMFGRFSAPLVFGEKAYSIIQYLEPFTFAMVCFSMSQIFVTYHLAKKIYTFPVVAFLMSIVQFGFIYLSHQNVEAIVWDMFFVSLLNLAIMSWLHFNVSVIRLIESNIADFFGLLSSSKVFNDRSKKNLRILILNWRDTKHAWAGGAEAYLHELSKVWVSQGINVTVFCGNDGSHERNEVVDGVQVVRRGGLYTVYIWALLYYVLRFRGKFDVVIDSANGIPFFTPFYVRVPKFLLIYHIHQEVFREHLPFGLSHFARFLEGTLMPLIYKNKRVITISNSTKEGISKLKFDSNNLVNIIHPGVGIEKYKKMEKTEYPTFIYLGRLQPYKNIDVAINAFNLIIGKYPEAKFQIAGFGEALKTLQELTRKLNIEKNVEFLGRVSEEEKRGLLAKSWVMVQPSMIEGWGITVIEANAAGTTVIASNVSGLRDSVIDGITGFLANPKDIKMFAKIMVNLIEDKENREFMSEQAYKWAQNFSWEESGRKFLNIIHEEVEKSQKVEFFIKRVLAKE